MTSPSTGAENDAGRELIADSADHFFFAMDKRRSQRNEFVYAWISQIPKSDDNLYRETKIYYRIQCREQRVLTLAEIIYGPKNKVVSSQRVDDNPYVEGSYVAPGTIGEAIYEWACV